MEPVVVVGGGISGVACARTLAAAGLPVTVLDRGRRLGGRMASRHIEGRPVDTGASYFTVGDSAFATVAQDWERRGLAHRWTDTFSVLRSGAPPTSKSGPVRWGTAGGMRSLVEDLATGLDVRRSEVRAVDGSDGTLRVDGAAAAAVVLAMPDAQARRLLGVGLDAESAALTRGSDPVLALVAWWDERGWDLDGGFVDADEHLAWVADDGRRRGDGAPVLVAHSTPAFAARHLEDPDAAGPAMTAALCRLLGLDPPLGTLVHRWSLAKPTGEREEPFLFSGQLLGVCGDGWGGRSKVEGAYLSGLALGEALVGRLG
jgi:predicted NAD/FAD-dependent oxidoreductase